MTTSAATAPSQRDARAAALLEQGRRQKAELDRMVKSSFAHSSSSSPTNTTARAGRMHPKDATAKLLDAEIDFARRNLRNTWLNLLFTCTFTREAQSIDGYIWNDTSYSLISAYRSYIAAAQKAVDPAVQAPGRRGKSAQDAQRVKTEYRKFLMDEEQFWQELVGRLVRLFSLDEARANLEVLGIDAENDGDNSVLSSLPPDSYASRATRQANEPDETLSQAALLPAKRIHLITLLHKFLIFCGDLARYREMSAHDQETVASGKKGKNLPKFDFSRASAFYEQARLILPDQGNPSNQLAVVSTYKGDTFASLYYYYRALCVKTPFAKAKVNLEKLLSKPASHYLEEFGRSGDSGNLKWDAAKEQEARDPQLVAQLLADVELAEQTTEAWLKQVVILHGLFYRRNHLDHIMYLSRSVLATFSTLVRARALRADQIVQFLVTALCASWTTRLWRSAPTSASRGSPRPSSDGSEDRHRPRAIRGERPSKRRTPSPETGRCVEFQVTAHVLGVFRELAAVDTVETRQAFEAKKETAAFDHVIGAQSTQAPTRNLTAVVRRTLPALRIVTKWTKTHLEYMQRIEKRARDSMQQYGETDPGVVRSEMEVRPESERPHAHQVVYADTLDSMDKCWSQYVDLINSLRYAFPFDSLPNIGKVGSVGAPALCLEEDSDMRGFAPTRKATQSTIPGGTTINVGMGEACANIEAARPSQVHPNEEQLMRIADLMIDAKVIAESDASPIEFDDTNNVFVFKRTSERPGQGGTGATGTSVAAAALAARSANNLHEADSVDDPVEAAMWAAMNQAQTPKDGTTVDVDSIEQSMRNAQVQDKAGAGSAGGSTVDPLFVPSQVRSKSFKNKDELARQLFAAYPIDGQSQQQTSVPSSNTSSSGPQQQSGIGSTGINRHANLLLSNGAPISSIWTPNASDMAGSASSLPGHLQPYAGQADSANLDAYQRQLLQQRQMGGYQHPWSNVGYQHTPPPGRFSEPYGNITPDPFNPHGYGGGTPQPQVQQMHPSAYNARDNRTPQPGNLHGYGGGNGPGPMQDPYYPGAGGNPSPRFQ